MSGMERPVSVLDRVLAILDQFTEGTPYLTLSEVSRGAGLNVTTTHRLLGSLLERGMVRRVDDRKYGLGPRLLSLANNAHGHLQLQQLALPIMRSLRDSTGETVGLHVVNGVERSVIDQVESRESLRRTYTNLGTPIPLNQGAPSKAILAYMPQSVIDTVLRGDLTPATERTLVDKDELREQLTQIVRDGYSLSFAEREPGISSVSVPFFDHSNAIAGSLSVTGPQSRLPLEQLEKFAPVAIDAGRRLSHVLGANLDRAYGTSD